MLSMQTLDPLVDGRFRLLEPIGHGASATVYRAEQGAPIGRPVAVKIFEEAHLAVPGALERFKREVQTIAALRHPNTIRLIDAGSHHGHGAYIVTELLSGESLSTALTRGSLPEARALAIALQIAGSIEEAHEYGVVHRDLKPSNVFIEQIGDDEHVKVLDFGWVKVPSRGGTSLTDPGRTCGRPGYRSP